MSLSRNVLLGLLLAAPIAGCESTQTTSVYSASAAAQPASRPTAPATSAPAKPAPAPSGTPGGLREVPRVWSGGDGADYAPAPAPAPEPVQTKPAAAPAPAAPMGAVLFVPTGARESSVLMVEKRLPREVVAGQPFDWDIIVTNLTANTVKGVSVFDDCVPAFTIVKSEPQFKQSSRGGVEWSLGDFKPREVKTIKVTSTVSKAGTISSCTSAIYNAELCLDTVVVSPALAIKCESMPAETLLCNPWEVKWTVTNTGTGSARNVKVSPVLPAGVSFASPMAETVIPALAAGESRVITARVKADKVGSYAVKGSAAADGGLTANTGDCVTVVKQPTLTLSATGPSSKIVTGRKATFEYTVSNTSDTPADGCRLVVNLPAGAKFASATDNGALAGNTVTWTIGTLAPKGSKKVSFSVDAMTAGAISTDGRLECACATAATANAKAEAIGIPAILVEKADNPDPIAVGESTTYTLSITNQGFANLTNVKMECIIPAGEAFVSGTGDTAVSSAGEKVTMGVIPVLAPKAKVNWKVVMKGTKAGDQRFRILVTSDEFKSPIEAIESTNVYE